MLVLTHSRAGRAAVAGGGGRLSIFTSLTETKADNSLLCPPPATQGLAWGCDAFTVRQVVCPAAPVSRKTSWLTL